MNARNICCLCQGMVPLWLHAVERQHVFFPDVALKLKGNLILFDRSSQYI